ncbi:hypothetical protein [Cellulomonas xiejunii]|uniref:Uncharacterized protein n=1 Tax=Cellulomonas xiejunii TaxID=2968083 RepID=A0ABY5KR84_9CELL|nr:hypothetical protein [Cellulomonas xiejunii]UUI72300.1 hypothetical protein NP048_02185 [Cellulomonas xiejunii]
MATLGHGKICHVELPADDPQEADSASSFAYASTSRMKWRRPPDP